MLLHTGFLYFKFKFKIVFAVVFVTKIFFGNGSAHFFIKSKGVFVFRVTAEIKFFDFIFSAMLTDIIKSFFADSFSAEFRKKIERLNVKRVFMTENEISGFFVVCGDEIN